ncbi:MAG: hypothetical protein ACLFUE_01325 [Desulfobacteraceae bacterium]
MTDCPLIRGVYEKDRADFVIKHNLRKESKESWLEIARERADEVKEFAGKRESGRIYKGSTFREVQGLQGPVQECARRSGIHALSAGIGAAAVFCRLNTSSESIMEALFPPPTSKGRLSTNSTHGFR